MTEAANEGFVVWDTSTPQLRVLMDYLAEQGLSVPAVGRKAGDVHTLSLAQGVLAHRRVFVFTDRPNVNVGYELGHALASAGKRVTLCHGTPQRPAWLNLPPLGGLVAHAIGGPEDLLGLGDEGFMPGGAHSLAGPGVLLLCPAGLEGAPVAHAALQMLPGLRRLPEQGWNLAQLPRLLEGIGEVLWVITGHQEGEAARDGSANACHAVVAGFAERCGARLHVLISASARPVADLEGRSQRFDRLESLRAELRRLQGLLPQPPAAGHAPTTPGLMDFGPLVFPPAREFVGRSWLRQALDAFLGAHDRGYAWIRALPGMGKTAFAAHLVRERSWPHHFNSRRLGVSAFADFQRNLCAQLVHAHALDLQAPGPEDSANGLYLARLLETAARQLVARGQRTVIVVDGLDEAEPGPEGSQPLFLPPALPSGIRVVVLGRPDPVRRLVADPPFELLDIDPADRRNLRDLRAFLRDQARTALAPLLAERRRRERWFVDAVAEASEGNFMYARCVVNDMLAGSEALPDIGRLPRGLDDYYERHWQSIIRAAGAGGWGARLLLPTLCVLSVSERPLTLQEVDATLRVAFPELAAAAAFETSAALERWGQFLACEPTAQGPSFQIYHKSFQEFLRRKPEVSGELAQRHAADWLSQAALLSLLGRGTAG